MKKIIAICSILFCIEANAAVVVARPVVISRPVVVSRPVASAPKASYSSPKMVVNSKPVASRTPAEHSNPPSWMPLWMIPSFHPKSYATECELDTRKCKDK